MTFKLLCKAHGLRPGESQVPPWLPSNRSSQVGFILAPGSLQVPQWGQGGFLSPENLPRPGRFLLIHFWAALPITATCRNSPWRHTIAISFIYLLWSPSGGLGPNWAFCALWQKISGFEKNERQINTRTNANKMQIWPQTEATWKRIRSQGAGVYWQHFLKRFVLFTDFIRISHLA